MSQRSHDHDDFDSWYRANHRRILASVALIVGDVDTASDIVDEACTRALERWPRVSTMASVDGWVFRVAMNLSKRRAARAAAERRIVAADASRARRSHVDAADYDVDLWAAVAALPRREREAVTLRYVAGLPERDVAAAMGVAPGTAARTLHDARARLAAALGDVVDEEHA
jgi:RNA polymerase sigma factor (sigma-70 family)